MVHPHRHVVSPILTHPHLPEMLWFLWYCSESIGQCVTYTEDSLSSTTFTNKQGIHRHQTLPRYRTAASGSRLKVQLSTHRHTAQPDVIHKTGSIGAYRITTPPEENRATATGDLQKTFPEDRSSGSRDTLTDRQTNWLQYSTPTPRQNNKFQHVT